MNSLLQKCFVIFVVFSLTISQVMPVSADSQENIHEDLLSNQMDSEPFEDNSQSSIGVGLFSKKEVTTLISNFEEKQKDDFFLQDKTIAEELPPVEFEFTASSSHVESGEEIEFTIRITNNTKSEVSGIFFSNSLPKQVINPKSENPELIFDSDTNTISWNGEKSIILPNETIIFNYTAMISSEIEDDIQVIDEADLFIKNPESSYVATLELGIFPQSEEKEFTLIGTESGEATGLDGQVIIDIPSNELSTNEGILIEDLSEEFQSEESAPLIVFQIDVASQIEIPQETILNNQSFETPTTTPTLIPTLTPEVLTLEPSSSPETHIPTITPTSTPEFSEKESLPIPTDIQEDSSKPSDELVPTNTIEPTVVETESDEELTITPTLTTTPTPTETPTDTPTIILPTPTLSETATITPTATLVDELPSDFQEQDTVSVLEVKENEFDNPVEITVSFNGVADFSTMGAEYQPYVVTLDESSGVWINVPITSTDIENNTVTVETNHFSTWGAGLGTFVPQNGASIPMFDTAYPDLFTGGAHYSIPIWTPPGRHSVQPNLSLSYSSRTVDGVLGDVQAPWVGMGWNIDTVEIIREINNISTCPTRNSVPADFCKDNVLSYGYRNKFTLLFNGSSSELIADTTTPGRYHTKSESFLYIQLHNANIGNSPSLNNTSGEWWEIVERDGTRWRLGWNNDSEQLAAMKGYPGAATGSWNVLGYAGEEENVVTKRWRADLVYDTFGNAMTFTYHEDSREVNGVAQNYDYANYLEAIYYTQYTSDQNINDGIVIDISPSAGYSVVFERETRTGDNGPIPADLKDWDNWDEERLKKIKVMYGATPIRVYTLSYSVPIYNSLYSTTVLDSVQITDGTEATSAPIIEFEYLWKDNISSVSPYPYPRMEIITNGYGGEVTYTYSNDNRTLSWYNWRVASLTIDDGGGNYSCSHYIFIWCSLL